MTMVWHWHEKSIVQFPILGILSFKSCLKLLSALKLVSLAALALELSARKKDYQRTKINRAINCFISYCFNSETP